MYVFGYGSLIWNPHFKSDGEPIPGIVNGYVRRFWQLSPDHRGTVENPGRTVTLVPEPTGQTWGLAYKIPDDEVESTFAYLNFRERAGYKCEQVTFYPDNGSQPFDLHVYISTESENNPYYTGPTDMDEVVSTIIKSKGKSGSNLEYALNLAYYQRKLAPYFKDDYLFDLEQKLIDACRKFKVEDKVIHTLGYDLPPIKTGLNNSEEPKNKKDAIKVASGSG